MAKAWILDLWVKDSTETLSTGERVKISPPGSQLRTLSKLEDRFKTAKFGRGKRWSVRWHETVDGKTRERARSFEVKVRAEEYVAELEDDIRSGRYLAPEHAQQRFEDVAKRWLASKKKPKPVTIRRYNRELTTYINPRWGSATIGSITREQIDVWVGELLDGTAVRDYKRNITGGPLSPASIKHMVGVVFGGVLRYCIDEGWMSTNPLAKVELPRIVDDGTDLVTLDHIEVHALATAAKNINNQDVDEVLTYFLSYTGMRINEALAQMVSDIDLDRGRARVLRTWTLDIDGLKILGPPKTWEKRTVPLSPFIVDMLRPLLDGREPDDFVFRAVRGGPILDANWRNRVWTKSLASAGLDEIGLKIHLLRHTAASSAIAAGADVKIVQLMLGHKDATETLNTYGHLWPDRLDEVSLKVDEKRREALAERFSDMS